MQKRLLRNRPKRQDPIDSQNGLAGATCDRLPPQRFQMAEVDWGMES